MRGLDSFETQAFELLQSRAREVFDVTREEPRTRDMYGTDNLGKQMLMARRLCEAGIGFVTIHFGGWDMHGQVTQGMRNLGPRVDRAVSAFVEDVHQRGLQDDILLVITGEFGRTPRINSSGGRDHCGAVHVGPLRRRPAHGPSHRPIDRQGGNAQNPADLAARLDGDGVSCFGNAAQPGIQRPNGKADADGERRAGDWGVGVETWDGSPEPSITSDGSGEPSHGRRYLRWRRRRVP